MDQKTFEEKLAHIEELINDIDSGKCDLETSMQRYEEAMKQLQEVEKSLLVSKQRLTMLHKDFDKMIREVQIEANERGVQEVN